MSVADAGFLISLIDADDRRHASCARVMRGLTRAPITTWPALTEAMHILGRLSGWRGLDTIWQMVLRAELDPRDVPPEGRRRCYELMASYRDVPMDLADATLVALAEAENDWQILTLDSHFRIYRPRGHGAFDILPDGE